MPDAPPPSLIERQSRLDERILSELVFGTPTGWTQIELDVEIVWSDEVLELSLSLHSPEGHTDAAAEVTVGLTTALAELAHLFHDHGMSVRRLRGLARQVDGHWRYAYTLA